MQSHEYAVIHWAHACDNQCTCMHSKRTDQASKWQLADQQLGRLLVLAYLFQCHRPRSEPVWLLRTLHGKHHKTFAWLHPNAMHAAALGTRSADAHLNTPCRCCVLLIPRRLLLLVLQHRDSRCVLGGEREREVMAVVALCQPCAFRMLSVTLGGIRDMLAFAICTDSQQLVTCTRQRVHEATAFEFRVGCTASLYAPKRKVGNTKKETLP